MALPPDEQRCRATTKGGMIRGAYWAPPKRRGHRAQADGYCWQHRPPERSAEDDHAPPSAGPTAE